MNEQEGLRKLEELKKQREELDKLIAELSGKRENHTNISYTERFKELFGSIQEEDISTIERKELLDIKLFINKKCNQISVDFEHTKNLISEINAWKDNRIFIHLFARKILEQGRIQVSRHFESYKPFSYVLYAMQSKYLIETYTSLMIYRNGDEGELCGIYSIYFGYLRLSQDSQALWFWLACVLNCDPSEYSGYILEKCLIICGEFLREKCGNQFVKILKYIKKFYIKELKNVPVETRLNIIIDKLLYK